MADTTPTESYFVVDGEEYKLDTPLSFKEQRTLRKYVRELAEDPNIQVEDATLADVLPALVTVIKQRTDEFFSLDMTDELTMEDVIKERPIRRPAKKAKPKAAAAGTSASGSTSEGLGTPS